MKEGLSKITFNFQTECISDETEIDQMGDSIKVTK